jgi:hypothetical protein
MSYAEYKRCMLIKRRRAVKSDIPEYLLNLVDYYIDKAIYFRTQLAQRQSLHDKNYDRAMGYLWNANEVLSAFLCNMFNRPKKYLEDELLK